MLKFVLKIISSVPGIIIGTYFSGILGFILLLIRLGNYSNSKNKNSGIILLLIGLIIILPKTLIDIFNKFDFGSINYLEDFINSDLYNNKIKYMSTPLMIIGFINLLLYKWINTTKKVFGSNILSTFNGTNNINDLLKIKNESKSVEEFMEKNKIEKVNVVCPSCGATNTISKSGGVCKFCKKAL